MVATSLTWRGSQLVDPASNSLYHFLYALGFAARQMDTNDA